jgi:mono/diheme cytochrome c family protein
VNKLAWILGFLILSGCGQDSNSNSGDAVPRTPVDNSDPQSQRRTAARAVLQTHCASCHGAWMSNTTDAQWIASGLIVAESSATSKLVYRLINEGSNMPQGGSALPDTEYQALRSWINKINDES